MLPPRRRKELALPGVELSIVLPTYKERDNIAELIRRLDTALTGIAWEAIFVDDNSPDGTAEAAKAIAARDPRVRCLRRVGRRGLAGACIEGILSSAAPYVAVMDADLQHDEGVLLPMLGKLRAGGTDLVAATRYVEGGSAEGLSNATRNKLSSLATILTARVLSVPLSDPMSGFFMLRRDRFDNIADKLSPSGFKILLDIVATAGPSLRVSEQSFVFGKREQGESKFTIQIGLEFLGLLFAKLTGDLVEPRFIFFILVGAIGLVIHLTVLRLALWARVEPFYAAQIVATVAAITSNFFLNNEVTYRDKRLKGWSMLRGFIAFLLFCSLGALTNVGIASWAYDAERVWWVAGLAGAVMGAFWNYAMSSLFVWQTR
ncbi:MAG: glycosyltransferase family 2 protein [Alphaproteobacteria bacterium]|nr:glycosyltransferase family 2 protein [Alphaproteobacteria bacterium]